MGPENKEDAKAIESSTMGDLHNEGIDVLDSSRVAEDNEFGTPELAAAKAEPAMAAEAEAPKQAAAPETSEKGSIELTERSFMPGGMNSSDPAPVTVKNDPSIKPLRTFKTDAEEAVRYQNISKAQMVIAEQKKRESAGTPIEYDHGEKRWVLPVILVSALALALGGGAYYWLSAKTSTGRSALPQNLVVKTLLPYDGIATVSLSPDKNPLDIAADALENASVNIGQIYAIIPLPSGTTTVIASPSAILSRTEMPGRLMRSLSSEYMLGSYVFNRNAPFLILKNTFFQNAYAGMLEWERDMRGDLIRLVQVAHPNEKILPTGTDAFEDSVVANIDARILRGAEGQPVLAYAFPDQSTIVIATDLETLRYLIERLLAVRVVQ